MTIGIFDSGLGGLTVLSEILKILPTYDYIYLGDNARAPYGDRSAERIYEFTIQGIEFLFKNDCRIVILACNTASALALRKIQQEWLPIHYPDRRVLGIIIPLVEHVSHIYQKQKKPKKIGIIGTRSTITSHVFESQIAKIAPKILPHIVSQACPLLVPLIEEGWNNTTPLRMIVKKYLRPLKQKQVSILILACTHYPLIQKIIQRVMGKHIVLVQAGPAVARSLKDYLNRHPEHESLLSKHGTLNFYTTDISDQTQILGSHFWDKPLSIKKISLE